MIGTKIKIHYKNRDRKYILPSQNLNKFEQIRMQVNLLLCLTLLLILIFFF
jgi:hypothetical protein